MIARGEILALSAGADYDGVLIMQYSVLGALKVKRRGVAGQVMGTCQ